MGANDTDLQQIRDFVSAWIRATQDGDLETVLSLLTDDVVFLAAGQPPMRKADFAAAARAHAGAAPRIEAMADIQEIRVLGDWAFMWTKLAVSVAPAGAAPMRRCGHAMSILRKEDGRWRLARDANMLVPEQPG